MTFQLTLTHQLRNKALEKVCEILEEDAINVLKFMASNGLMANPSKTSLMFRNLKQEGNEKVDIMVGKVKIVLEDHVKLLGMVIKNNQCWKTQIEGKAV